MGRVESPFRYAQIRWGKRCESPHAPRRLIITNSHSGGARRWSKQSCTMSRLSGRCCRCCAWKSESRAQKKNGMLIRWINVASACEVEHFSLRDASRPASGFFLFPFSLLLDHFSKEMEKHKKLRSSASNYALHASCLPRTRPVCPIGSRPSDSMRRLNLFFRLPKEIKFSLGRRLSLPGLKLKWFSKSEPFTRATNWFSHRLSGRFWWRSDF